jgi:hypothetical protein
MREDEQVRSAPRSKRLPLRVLVKGASTVVYTSWMGGPREDLTYPRVIEGELLAAGHAVEVHTTAAPAERVTQAFRTYQADVIPWSPDVVILHYGHADAIHLFLPRWLERHVNSMGRRPGRMRTAYRKLLLRPSWVALAHLQKHLDGLLRGAGAERRARRFARDLEGLIRHVRFFSSPLLLVPNLHPMGPQYQVWFPGIDRRMLALNAAVAEMVDRLALPDVQVVDVRSLAEPILAAPHDGPTDDSHVPPVLHRAVGRELAKVIAAGAVDQAYLDLPKR